MIRRIPFILILTLVLASCGGAAPAPTEAPAITEVPAVTEAPAEPLVAEISPTLEPTQTFTPEPTYTPSVTPTETQLPPLELPTEAVNAPARMVWDGAPTYLGDSTPGYAFRVTYDPDLWAVTSDQFGFPALGHRNIEYCVIAVTSGAACLPMSRSSMMFCTPIMSPLMWVSLMKIESRNLLPTPEAKERSSRDLKSRFKIKWMPALQMQ